MNEDNVPSARIGNPLLQGGPFGRARQVLPLVVAQARSGIERLSETVSLARSGPMPRIGALTGTGLALLTASAVLWLGTLAPLRQSVAELRHEVGRLESGARTGGAASPSIAGQASAFVRKLPTRNDMPGVLTAVVAQAEAAGLELPSGEYEFMPAKAGRIHRYRLALPVRGTYAQVRRFIDGTLAALPAVALEGLKLERENIGDEQLEAELKFAVMVRSES